MEQLQENELHTRESELAAPTRLSLRVALLTNIIPPYLLPVFTQLSQHLRSLRIFLSVPMESNRAWPAQWGSLDVTLQKSFRRVVRQTHPQGFTARVEQHFPYDTLRLLMADPPSVVISAQLGFRTIQSALYRAICKRSRLVIWVDASEHTERRVGRLQTALRRILLRRADAILAVGQSGRRYVEKLQIPCARVVEIPFVTDVTAFQACSLERDAKAEHRLIYVGQLIERKGLIPFVRGLASWARAHSGRNYECWFVGDGPLRGSLEKAERPRNLVLKFFGNVPYTCLPNLYAQAGICVLPTLADTWALVVNEALAAGAPVLGSLYSQAVEQLVRDGENGWTYYPDKPNEVERALDRVFGASGRELARMRQAARASVEHLTPEFAVECLLQVIELAQSDLKSSASNSPISPREKR